MPDDSHGFTPLSREHFGSLAAWLDEPLVARWWNHESSREAIERDFGAAIDRTEPTEVFLVSTTGRPFGLIQRYPIDAFPDYQRELSTVCPVRPATLSIDYLIGEPAMRGIGEGASMIAAFIAASWAAYPEAPAVLVPVCAGNLASWRAVERAGLRRIAEGELEPDNPRDPRDHYVYQIERPGNV